MLTARNRYAFILATCLALSIGSAAAAQEQPVCGNDVKAYIADVLSKYENPEDPEALSVQKQLYEKFKYCAPDNVQSAKLALYPQRSQFCGLSYAGNLYWEQMRCCGYHPQQRAFGCPIDIKQPYGYGPAHFPGSHEHVLTCVDFLDGAGFQPVALDRVHLADAVSGTPPWQFAVIAKARGKLAEVPNKGQTYLARSILSWELVPTHCKYAPIWGNAIDYQIRLDP
jgi:hypothetical protein